MITPLRASSILVVALTSATGARADDLDRAEHRDIVMKLMRMRSEGAP
jgi:hypothetical protein